MKVNSLNNKCKICGANPVGHQLFTGISYYLECGCDDKKDHIKEDTIKGFNLENIVEIDGRKFYTGTKIIMLETYILETNLSFNAGLLQVIPKVDKRLTKDNPNNVDSKDKIKLYVVVVDSYDFRLYSSNYKLLSREVDKIKISEAAMKYYNMLNRTNYIKWQDLHFQLMIIPDDFANAQGIDVMYEVVEK